MKMSHCVVAGFLLFGLVQTSSFAEKPSPKTSAVAAPWANRRPALQLSLPPQSIDETVAVTWTDDMMAMGSASATWSLDNRANEYAISADKDAKTLKVVLYRRGYKIINQEFDVSGGKIENWTPSFERLPTTPLTLHLIDAAGKPIVGEKLRLGFVPNTVSYLHDNKKGASMGLETLWSLGESETDANGNVTLAVASLALDENWMKHQEFDSFGVLVERVRKTPKSPGTGTDFSFGLDN